jgi:MoaA/NifB/PqqE/SkfB family radical SAM enzyme
VDQSSYEKYQVGGQFEKVMENIRLLQKRKRERNVDHPLVDWQFLIMKHNIGMQEEATRMARELGIGIRFSRIGVDLTDEKECSEWLPDEAARKELNFEDQILKNMEQIPLCSWLYRMAFINWDLGVSPCCNYYTGDKSHDFGSLRERSFSDIWNNTNYVAARRVFMKGQSALADSGNICRICVQKRIHLKQRLTTTTV